MTVSVLQEFLDAGMLPIGEDDQKFEFLRMAAESLAETLREDRTKLIPYRGGCSFPGKLYAKPPSGVPRQHSADENAGA